MRLAVIDTEKCVGRSAIALRMAGYGALVIRGTSSTPVYIAVHGDKVLFRDASTLWGMEALIHAKKIITGER
jgi:aldehyde:ferredoxin oxidoreductase